jgi:Peptidase family M23
MTRFMPMRASTYQISSKYGQRSGGMHWGMDFAAADGTKIFAAQSGSVEFIGPADGFGQWIVVDHPAEAGSGTTVYGHMWDAHQTGLRRGDHVRAGQHIAFVGNNGQSSGAHLHFEVHPTVWKARTQIDPKPWLAGALEPGDAISQREAVPMPKSDHDMLVEIYELLTTPLPSRSIYRDNNQPVDIWRGMLLNIDGMTHEALIEREALLGFKPAIETVVRCVESSADARARERAKFILGKIVEQRKDSPAKTPTKRAARVPAKKAQR